MLLPHPPWPGADPSHPQILKVVRSKTEAFFVSVAKFSAKVVGPPGPRGRTIFWGVLRASLCNKKICQGYNPDGGHKVHSLLRPSCVPDTPMLGVPVAM